ncbi:TPA: hypothetical protein N0F65_010573 [Lagenidium giganteum]|uniref:Transmembrane protein 230 n=1 Tax=Lagenidium giganteum TaxID=4803 RepID=A0AAV2ZIF3_9STRA|nr:TPA: hypothetical protein N0F65_010573 [Lagenidium giganteum]
MVKDVRAHEVRRQERVEDITERKARGDGDFSDIARAKHSRYDTSDYDLRRKKFPIRTGIAAISLFTLGSILIWVSTRIGLDGEHRGLSFLILGLIAFIPGSYATTQLYGSWKGWKGYCYSQIPSYDD